MYIYIISGYLGADISLPHFSSSMLMNQKKLLHTNKENVSDACDSTS